MDMPVLFALAIILLAVAEADLINKGPHMFEETQEKAAPKPKRQQPRYVMKEVILYLTPSQIRALEAGQGLVKPEALQQHAAEATAAEPELNQSQIEVPHLPIPETPKEQPQEIQQQLEPVTEQRLENTEPDKNHIMQLQEVYRNLQAQQHNYIQELAKLQEERQIELQKENYPEIQPPQSPTQQSGWVPIPSPPPENFPIHLPFMRLQDIPDNYAYFYLYPRTSPVHNENLQLFAPEPQIHKIPEQLLFQPEKTQLLQTEPISQQQFQLKPYGYSNEQNQMQEERQKQEAARLDEEHQKLQGLSDLQPKEPQLNTLLTPLMHHQNIDAALKQEKENLHALFSKQEDDFSQQQYAPSYNNEKYVKEVEKILQKNHIQKQNALVKALAIANEPPIVIKVDRKVNIKKAHPVPIIKHVTVPVPTPVIVPVPKPFEVKVPQPYPVPLEIIRHVPVPMVKTEKLEVEKPVPYEVEKQVPFPVTKNVYVKVDKPFYVQRMVPVEIKKIEHVPVTIRKPHKFTIVRHVYTNS